MSMMIGPTQAERDHHEAHGGYDNFDPNCRNCVVMKSIVMQARILILVFVVAFGITVAGLGHAVGWW